MGCSASRPITIISNKTPENHFPIPTTSESSDSSSPNQTQTQTPKAFSLTTPLIHHPPIRKGDTHHLVSLTSTTYGYASLLTPQNDTTPPKTTPPPSLSPDSVINTWELMHDLDDDDDPSDLLHPSTNLRRPISTTASCRYPHHHHHQNDNDIFSYLSFSSSSSSSKPLWQHLSEESLLAKMDPNVAQTYRRALSSRHLSFPTKNRHSKTHSLGSTPTPTPTPTPTTSFPTKNDTPHRAVLYFTTLRGVRKTYEDCCAVRAALRGFGVAVDERDVSMDSDLKAQLKALLGDDVAAATNLPHVFVKGRHVGGAAEVLRLHEAGELAPLLEGVRKGCGACGACGEARFVPCGTCWGSRKVFADQERELRRCKDCNENGLVRCPSCCF